MTHRTPILLLSVALVGGTLAVAGPADARNHGMNYGGGGMGAMLDFDTLDTDGDGTITAEEIATARAEMVAGIDADGDGLISAEEIAAFHMRGAQQRADAMAVRMIEALDADGDGALSAAELLARPMPMQMMMRMFDRVDADGDGAITRQEWDDARATMREHRREMRGERGNRRGDGDRPRRRPQAD